MKRKLITPATVLPVALEAVRQDRRVDITDDDDVIIQKIWEAADLITNQTNYCFTSQTWELALDSWSDEVALLPAPVASITSVTYVDADDAGQTLDSSNYELDDYGIVPILRPAYNVTYPVNRGHTNDIKIRYVAGVADITTIPGSMIAALKMIVGDIYENREAREPIQLRDNRTVTALLTPHWIPL